MSDISYDVFAASLVMVMNCIRTAKIAECLDCLCRLVAPCDLWSQLRLSILSTIPRATEQRMEEDRRYCIAAMLSVAFKHQLHAITC